MSTLLDTIITEGYSLAQIRTSNDVLLTQNIQFLKPYLEKAHCINIDGSAKYYHNYKEKDWSMRDFPNIAPPFNNYFMEYIPKNVFTEVNGNLPKFMGTLLLSTDKIDAKTCLNIDSSSLKNVKWYFNCYLFTLAGTNTTPIIVGMYFFYLDKNGDLVKQQDGHELFFQPFCDIPSKELDLMVHDIINVNALSTSFLHCKNLILRENKPSEKLNKKRIKRGKKPFITFKTIEIEPMKEILKNEGKSELTGLKNALHICRGHFKDFREGGLFGRTKGLFWWNEQIRGNKQEGVIFKDYSITQPTKEIL